MSKITRLAGHPAIDGFVLSLFGVVLAATLLPCRGEGARAVHAACILAIGALFFLQGARLSRDAVLRGVMHWRLHAAINATTYLLFPLLGLSLIVAFPHLLPPVLFLGVLFLCALPSTVQSSIALVSIAGGNVPAAVCSATASNIAGIVLAPLLFGAMAHLHGGGGTDLKGLWQVVRIARRRSTTCCAHGSVGAERNRGVLSITDRGSILLVVYGAFSAALLVHGIWRQMPLQVLAALAVLMGLLLALILAVTIGVSRTMGLPREDEAALVFLRLAKVAGQRGADRQCPDVRRVGRADPAAVDAVLPDAACDLRLARTALRERRAAAEAPVQDDAGAGADGQAAR